MSLKDKIDDFQVQTGTFANLCEYVQFTKDNDSSEYFQKLLQSMIYIISIEARRIEEVSDEIFGDKRMIAFSYSDKCKEEIT